MVYIILMSICCLVMEIYIETKVKRSVVRGWWQVVVRGEVG